jgi:hypothetical protein
MERQMGTPSFVDDQRLATLMTDLGDPLQVGAGAIGARTDDQRTRGVGMVLPRLADPLG